MDPPPAARAPRPHPAAPLLVFVLSVAALLPGLGARHLWDAAEGRGPLVARDLLRTGRIQPPYLLGEPYLQKPPLHHALVALSFRASGREDAFAARIPVVLAAALTAMLVFLIASDRAGAAAGFGAAFFLLLSVRFLTHVRSAEMDGLLAAAASLSYLGITRGLARPGTRWWIVAAAGAAIAALTKGPLLALLFPGLLLAAEAVARRSWAPLIERRALLIAAGAVAATLLYYVPLLERHRDELVELLKLGFRPHRRPPHYYLWQFPLGLLPALLLLPAMLGALRRDRGLVAFPVAALLGAAILSAAESKQSHYLLPLYPLVAVWGGIAAADALRSGRRLLLALPAALVALALPAGWFALARTAPWLEGRRDLFILTLAAAAGSGLVAVALVRRHRRERRLPLPAASGVLIGLVLVAALVVADTVRGVARDPVESAAPAMALFASVAARAPLASLERNPSDLYYLGRDDVARPADEAEALAFLQGHPDGYLIVKAKAASPPPALAGAAVAAAWAAPGGRNAMLLLGPGVAR